MTDINAVSEPTFDPEKVDKFYASRGHSNQQCVRGIDYDKLLALYRQSQKDLAEARQLAESWTEDRQHGDGDFW